MKIVKKSTLIFVALLLIVGLVYFFYAAPKYTRTAHKALQAAIQTDKLPRHIAVMMDGNGRWATKQGKPRIFGHQHALQSLRELIEGCIDLHIPYLTLYAFSTENWDRPAKEVAMMMDLLATTLQAELKEFLEHDVKLTAIGDIQRLPQPCQVALEQAIEATKHNQGLQVIVALSYSGRWELTQAARSIAADVANNRIQLADINAALFQSYLTTKDIPDPDLLIRTGGDMRVSNFLLWQIAYTELVVIPTYWPAFKKDHLYEAIITYQQRERRFGKIHQ